MVPEQRYDDIFLYSEEMNGQGCLGEFELMVLLTTLHLGDQAYGVPLARELAQQRGREISVSSVYAALERLEAKGLIASRLGSPTQERGGRAKRFFHVTAQGLRAIHNTRNVLSSLWQSLPALQREPL